MCGIVGFQGSFSAELLQRMSVSVAHRGPDGEGSCMIAERGGGFTGLGHRRLAIIDLSDAGCQPMTVAADPGGGMREGLTLIFNGEIYNYRELRARLEQDGHRFLTNSDCEVILGLYERHGDQRCRGGQQQSAGPTAEERPPRPDDQRDDEFGQQRLH